MTSVNRAPLILILILVLFGLPGLLPAQSSPEAKIELSVMAWNILHGGRDDGEKIGPRRVIEIIRESGVDVVAMQETYGSGELISKELGFQFHPRGTNVSIHSRFPVVEDLSVFEPFKCVGALLELPGKRRLAFFSIWLPYNREIWEEGTRDVADVASMRAACQASCDDLKKIQRQIAGRLSKPQYAGLPVVIAGDFNSMSHLDYIPSATDEYEVIVDWPTSHVLEDAGYRDAWRELHPEVDRAADRTWSPRFPKQQQDRIDFVYYRGEGLEAESAEIIDTHREKFPSDHAALVTRFAWRGKAGATTRRLRVVSYNIRHGLGTDRRLDLERTASLLRNLKPDILGLQEVDKAVRRSDGIDQPEFMARRLGMNATFGAFMDYQGGEYGMAILSRYPIVASHDLRLPEGNEPRVALAAEIELPDGTRVMAVNVHFDWVADDSFRYKQARRLADYLAKLKIPYVLLGDFNDQPGSRTLDLFQESAKAAPKPKNDRFTFPSTGAEKEIDFIFGGPPERWSFPFTKVLDARRTSDHRPLLAIAELNSKASKGELDLFPSDRVLEIRIKVDDADWEKLRRQTRNFVTSFSAARKDAPPASPFTYVPASVSIDGVEFPKVGIRKKGFIGSLSSSRPSLKIKLNDSEKSARIAGMKNLTLNNNKQDIALVSAKMGYEFFNAAGSPAPRCAHARVTVNGKSLGVYSHVEAIRKPFLRRSFGTDKGTLYEGTSIDFFEGWENGFEHKLGPDELGRKKIAELIGVLENAKSPSEIGELIDLDAFYTFWAVESLLGFWDGYSGNKNNYFIYLHPKSRKFHFIPWGADALFEKSSPLQNDLGAPISAKSLGLIAHTLYQFKKGRAQYERTLRRILDTIWEEEGLLAEMDRLEALVAKHRSLSQLSSGEALEERREFVRTRRAEILAEIADGMPLWKKTPDPPYVLEVGPAGQDTIWDAARRGSIEDLRRHLLSDGADADAVSQSGARPLQIAALAGRTQAVRFLIGRGADLDARDQQGSTALLSAAFMGQADVVVELLEAGSEFDLRNDDGATALDAAAMPWNQEVEGLVDFIAYLMQMSPDHERVRAGRKKSAALLRKKGARHAAELESKPAANNIWTAAKKGDLRHLKAALESGADPNQGDGEGVTPLNWAAMAGQAAAASLLIEKGAKVDAANKVGSTALHSASFFGQVDIIELLLENRANVNARGAKNQTPLDSVIGDWSPEIQFVAEYLIKTLKLDADVASMKAARPKVEALLRKYGAKTSEELK